ncbi:MAG: helix-turn-helix domain-containing protein [Chordicoccus sp.]
MSRKSKIDSVIKVKAVEKVITGKASITRKAREIGVRKSTLERWMLIYQAEGPTGLLPQKRNRVYSKETKRMAVSDYLSGKGSQMEISAKYRLRSTCQLVSWIKAYNTQGTISSRGSGGGSYMKKARKTTLEERIKIVRYCLDHDRNYGKAAVRYQCSYQQVRNWVGKYEAMGRAGLEDRRGKRAGTLPGRTEEETLRNELARLKRENEDLKMENELLKKLRELKIKDRCL